MDASQDFKTLRDAVQAALVTVTRSVNGIANEDLQFQRTVHPSVASRLDQNTEHLLQLASGVLKSAAKLTAQRESRLEDVDDVEIQWRGIVDVVDSLLEKSDTCLDEYTGLIKRKDAPTSEIGRDTKRPKSTGDRLDWSLKRANILKPQNAFERKVDNFESGPWKPLLTDKPHAQLPPDQSLTTFVDDDGRLQYRHPYEHEILNMQYPRQIFQSRPPVKYLPMETTKAVWVDTYEGVLDMLEELKKATEIAIDLEHHDFRSYTGLLSLMQISTREKDWIVDTLVPWRHKLEVLNEVFADPKVVKVLHGAFMDIIWLQRDLGLYIVGLFDTHHASDVLGYAGRSLAFLLKKFVDFDADKKYQLADWRIRPLPDEMFYYARSDTHYLLYIYDMLRNELVDLSTQDHSGEKPIDRVIQKSRDVSLQRYEHPVCDLETGAGSRGWYNTLIKSPTLYNGEQFAVYKAVHKWRDDLARREDESLPFIMTQHALADIARILPSDKKALWSLLDTNARGLKVHLDELFDVVQEARARGANGLTMMEFFRQSTGGFTRGPVGSKQVRVGTEADNGTLGLQELKTEQSQLWGNVALSSAWDGPAKGPALDDQVEIPLFYFDFTGVKPEDELPQVAGSPAASTSRGLHSEDIAALEDKGFTLKGGHMRKASDASFDNGLEAASLSDDGELEMDEAEVEPIAGPIAADDDALARKTAGKRARRAEFKRVKREAQALIKQGSEEEAKKLLQESKRAYKAATRAARREQKQRQQQPARESQAEQEPPPFDYSKAESVLHASKAKGRGNGKAGKGTFDPYARKSGDAPQGVRKLNYERAGRTATFKQ